MHYHAIYCNHTTDVLQLTDTATRWQVGDKLVDYNEGFRMVLVTRIPDPELPPCAAALLCEVNFTVTRSGLEGQLLGVTIQHEQPELERAKSEMLAKEEAFKVPTAAQRLL
jgi:dynein heavy chain 2, cytosolic